jgi:hypothetical protein
MFKDINLQDLAWIIVKSRLGLLYTSRLISQPSTSHAIATSDGWAIFLVSGEKLEFVPAKPLAISSPGLKLPRRWLW